MWSEIRLEGFKAFNRSQRAPLAPLTLLYGPNSGGKSSLVQSLLLLKQSLRQSRTSLNALDFNGTLVDIGDFRNAVFKHDRRSFRLGVSFSIEPYTRDIVNPLPPSTASRSVDLQFALMDDNFKRHETARRNTYVGVESCRFALGGPGSIDGKTLLLDFLCASDEAQASGLRIHEDRGQQFFRVDPRTQDLMEAANYVVKYFAQDLQRVDDDLRQQDKEASRHWYDVRRAALINLLESSLFATSDFLPSTLQRAVANRLSLPKGGREKGARIRDQYLLERYGLTVDFVSRFADEVRFLFGQLSYVGPFRRPLDRLEVLRERDTATVGKSGELLHYMIYNFDRNADKLNSWLKHLCIPYELHLDDAELKENSASVGRIIHLRYIDQRFATSVATTDIGFGIGQVIPIVVEGMLSSRRTIVVEQPELHLHPKLQADLADLLIETMWSKRNPLGNQWIVETHSELILLRILKRIREGLDASTVKVLYVDPRGETTEAEAGSRIYELEINQNGRFNHAWPEGFFEEQNAEMLDEVAQ